MGKMRVGKGKGRHPKPMCRSVVSVDLGVGGEVGGESIMKMIACIHSKRTKSHSFYLYISKHVLPMTGELFG